MENQKELGGKASEIQTNENDPTPTDISQSVIYFFRPFPATGGYDYLKEKRMMIRIFLPKRDYVVVAGRSFPKRPPSLASSSRSPSLVSAFHPPILFSFLPHLTIHP